MKCQGTSKFKRPCKNNIKNGKFCRHHLPHYEKPNDCPICMESLFQVVKPLECGHWVHMSCLKKYAAVKFEAEIERFYEGYMPSLNIECPLCKHVLEDDKIEHPSIILNINKNVMIEAIKLFIMGVPLEKSLFMHLTNLYDIHDEELYVIFFEISYILRSMIIYDLNQECVKNFLETFILTSPPEWDTILFNLSPEENKIYSRHTNIIYNMLKASDKSELIMEYQL